MAGVRDPAFWKRFSTAVHLDEEQQAHKEPSSSWLSRENAKKSRRTWICWSFWLCLLGFIAAIVAVIIWLISTGRLKGAPSKVT